LKNSGDSQRSERGHKLIEAAALLSALVLLAVTAAIWCYRSGYILYYGDAQAHLNISRSIIDSRTPGYDQLGTVWLPVLHVICLPLVGDMNLWLTGLAGTIPVSICFIAAGCFFYYAAKEVYGARLPAAVVVACLALNPNVLYLSVIPMTEIVFAAGLGALLFSIFRFRNTQERRWVLLGIAASWFMSLTRYDGWFLVPFSALAFALAAKQRRVAMLILFGCIAALAPLYWCAHNWWETGNALDFYNGPYSARAIQGGRSYPGYHDWIAAAHYYWTAGELCAGWPLVVLGAAGAICAVLKRVFLPLLFLLLIPVFYIWSIHSSGLPIHVPGLWPHSYYNTRYGIAVVFLAAFAAGAVVLLFRQRLRACAWLLPVIAIFPWLAHPSAENVICWKESQVNSDSRRAWTAAAANYFRQHYVPGEGIFTTSGTGDIAGIFCRARIPLSEVLHEGNGPAWLAAKTRPDLLHRQLWAVTQRGDLLSRALQRFPEVYASVLTIDTKDDPELRIARRAAP
jgi:hypothetical protein